VLITKQRLGHKGPGDRFPFLDRPSQPLPSGADWNIVFNLNQLKDLDQAPFRFGQRIGQAGVKIGKQALLYCSHQP